MTHPEPEPAAARAAAAAARDEQIAAQTDLERCTDRARGLMLGVALGESIGLRRHQSSSPTITAGVATHRSIDHISVPVGWDVHGAYRVSAQAHGRRLSDHDAYVIAAEV